MIASTELLAMAAPSELIADVHVDPAWEHTSVVRDIQGEELREWGVDSERTGIIAITVYEKSSSASVVVGEPAGRRGFHDVTLTQSGSTAELSYDYRQADPFDQLDTVVHIDMQTVPLVEEEGVERVDGVMTHITGTTYALYPPVEVDAVIDPMGNGRVKVSPLTESPNELPESGARMQAYIGEATRRVLGFDPRTHSLQPGVAMRGLLQGLLGKRDGVLQRPQEALGRAATMRRGIVA